MTDRREQDRRRRHHLLSDWHWGLRGRRRAFRRQEDQGGLHLDWYPSRLLALVLAIFVLSIVDAALTLYLLRMGVVEEANPFMRPLLAENRQLFVNVKVLVTAVGLVALAVYSRLRLGSGLSLERYTVWILVFYVALVGYESVLVAIAHGLL